MFIRNKAVVKLGLVSLVTIFAIASVSFLLPGFSQASYTVDDFFISLIENSADLTEGIAIFELKNPTLVPMDINKTVLNLRLQNEAGATHISSIEYLILQNVSYPNNITDYSTECSNSTSQNGTIVTSCSIQANRWYWDNYTMERFVPLNSVKIQPGESARIKVIAHWKAKLGTNNREWFPQVTVAGNTYEQTRWAWWNITFAKKKLVTITNPMAEYQIRINVTYDSDMNSDFSDLRFTNASENQELSYYVFNKVNSYYADVFVRTRDSGDIYMYYGNSSATSRSNGDAVFLIFDNFTGNSLNTTKWDSTGGCINVSGGYLVENTSAVFPCKWQSARLFDTNAGVEVFLKVNASTNIGNNLGIWDRISGDLSGTHLDSATKLRNCDDTQCASISSVNTENWAGSAFSEFNLTFKTGSGGATNLTRSNGNSWTNIYNVASSGSRPVGAHQAFDWGFEYFDYIFVANYTFPRPTYIMGEEQSQFTEAEAIMAITNGVRNSTLGSSAPAYKYQQVYTRNSSDQILKTFDIVTSNETGVKRWLFNYVNSTDSPSGIANMTPVVFVHEIRESEGLTGQQITDRISKFINETA